jgi:hypothetical protein
VPAATALLALLDAWGVVQSQAPPLTTLQTQVKQITDLAARQSEAEMAFVLADEEGEGYATANVLRRRLLEVTCPSLTTGRLHCIRDFHSRLARETPLARTLCLLSRLGRRSCMRCTATDLILTSLCPIPTRRI